MKYAKFSDDFLSDFRLDDNGETLVLTDNRGYTRAVKLLTYDEKPQGEWKLLYKGDDGHAANYECSICQREIYFDPKTESLTDYPFCHCGAKMKGGAE